MEGNSAYLYDLVNDSIIIHYEGDNYQARVITSKDSLVFEGRDGTLVFTRFRE
jgi:Cu/Zn superoxide dismutase